MMVFIAEPNVLPEASDDVRVSYDQTLAKAIDDSGRSVRPCWFTGRSRFFTKASVRSRLFSCLP